jgi:hypothetical protein
MNRFIRVLGIIGAVGAVIWAMRDRFVSLTVPREPEPPAFRTPSPHSPARAGRPSDQPAGTDATTGAEPDDLTEVNGIGPVFAQRLADAGITTYAALAGMTEEQLTETLGSRLGKTDSILDEARRRAEL